MSDEKRSLFRLDERAKEALIRKSLSRARHLPLENGDGAAAPGSDAGMPEELTRFDRMAGYQAIVMQRAAAKTVGLQDPFNRVHDGIAGSTTHMDGRELVNFSSYDYLALNGDPRVVQAAKEALDRWGPSVSASRLVAGERSIHRELEAAIAEMLGVEACLSFVSGVITNVSTIGHLFGPRDLVVHDALIHNSVLQGIRLSGASQRSFRHNDVQHLDELLTRIRHEFERVLVVVEGLYSMDGDIPDLPQLIEVKRRHGAFLMVDEAHSIGVLGQSGKGISEHFGMDARDVDIWMGTLSKSLCSCGGYIAGSNALVDLLRYSAPGFVYSVGMSPPLAAAALEALHIMLAEPERVQALRQRSRSFLSLARERGVDTATCQGFAVVPAIIRNSLATVRVAARLFDRGINVQPAIPPGVEPGKARLRFFISSGHTEEQIRLAVEALAEELARAGVASQAAPSTGP